MSASDSGERPPDELHAERFAIIPEWLLDEKGDVVKLYGKLDRYAGRDRQLWPGQEELAEQMGCSIRQVRYLLSRLRQIGALEVIKRRYNGTTVYRLRRERPAQPCLTDRHECASPSGTLVPPNENQLTRAKNESQPLAPTAPARRDLLFEAVAEACGIDWRHLTQRSRAALNTAVADIREAGGFDAENPAPEVGRRARRYRAHFRDAALTPMALAKHWPMVARMPTPTMTASEQMLATMEDT